MKRELYEAYLLTQEELGILLMASKCEGYYGFPVQNIPIHREELLLKLHDMVRKELLWSDGKNFYMEKGISKVIQRIIQAKEMLFITIEEPELPLYCCYPGEEIVIYECMSRRKSYVKLRKIKAECFLSLLKEEGYYSEFAKGSYQIRDNRSGNLKKSLTLSRNGLQQSLCLEEQETVMTKYYTEEAFQEMFRFLIKGEFYDISGCICSRD